MILSTLITDSASTLWNLSYRYFFRYFMVSEVGELWAMFNNLIGFFGICVGLIYLAKPWGLRKWNRNVVKNKRRLRALAFRKLTDELSKANDEQQKKRRRITELSFVELRDELQNEKISASDAVDAFRWKSMECQEKYNCVVEFLKESTSLAEDLDKRYQGRTKPPLFGMPFSVKENFCIMGYDCSRGIAKELEWPVKVESSFVLHLRSIGAIPIVRTNVPQTMLSYMCSNLPYGTTLNPYDTTRTPGGSSGGEACLIASGGCPFGIGSDIGGSMRIPAHFCGVTSLKPTSGRLRATGSRPGVPGVVKLAWSCGFFTKDVTAQSILLQSTLVQEYFNRVPQCFPLPFNQKFDQTNLNRLRIGYYVDDGWFPSTPSCKNGVLRAKRILESIPGANHELIPFTIPEPERAMRIILKCLFMDNGVYWLKNLEYEDVDPNLRLTQKLLSLPLFLRWLASNILAMIDRKASTVVGAYVKNLSDLRSTYEEADAYMQEFFDYWTTKMNVDVVIGTTMPFPAVQHDCPTKLSNAIFGTAIYNLMDLPVGVVPVGKVTKKDEQEMDEYPDKETAVKFFQNPQNKLVRQAMAGSEGLPVCVQVIGLPFKEELVLKVMKMIEHGNK